MERKVQDIEINNNFGVFKILVCGVVKQGDYILAQKSRRYPGYCLPGGHVEIREDVYTAVVREMEEELQTKIKLDRMFLVNENFFMLQERLAHEIAMYFYVHPETDLPKEDFALTENDNGNIITHYYHWIHIDQLDEENLKPNIVRQYIKQDDNSCPYVVTKDKNVVGEDIHLSV